MTNQRRIILNEIRRSDSHPTAGDIYESVRMKIPTISLGTVYRNLEVLSDKGLIRKIEVSGSQRHYDGEVSDHWHVRCTNCGKLEDVPVEPPGQLAEAIRRLTSYEVRGQRIEFTGICPQCRGQNRENPQSDERAAV